MNPNVKSDNRTTVGVTAMWLACVLVAFNAQAGDVRSETVKFADLNLGAAGAAATLYGRIHAAAQRVCEQPGGKAEAVRRCTRKAESDAIGRVNNSQLTAFYQKKTGSPPQTITANR